MKKTNKIVGVVIIVLLLALTVSSVLAAPLSATRYDSVGGVSVTAWKTLSLGTYGWFSNLYSTSAQAINIIGYTYWTVEEYCMSPDYYYAFWDSYPDDYDTYDAYYATGGYFYYQGCSNAGISRIKSHGSHDFANGSDHIYPYRAATTYKSY